jgi:hypothetical protein
MMNISFDTHSINRRKLLLDSHFSNESHAEKIINSIWEA